MQHWKPFAATALVGIEWDFAIRQPLLAVFTKLWKCSKQAYLLSCLFFFFASPSPCFPFSRCYLFSLLQKEKSCSHSGKDHKVGHFENRVKMHWQRKMRSIKSGVGRKEGRKEKLVFSAHGEVSSEVKLCKWGSHQSDLCSGWDSVLLQAFGQDKEEECYKLWKSCRCITP